MHPLKHFEDPVSKELLLLSYKMKLLTVGQKDGFHFLYLHHISL